MFKSMIYVHVPPAFKMCLSSAPGYVMSEAIEQRVATCFLSCFVDMFCKVVRIGAGYFFACQLELWKTRHVTALDLLALLSFNFCCTVSELLRYIAMASKLGAAISDMDPMEKGDTHLKFMVFQVLYTYVLFLSSLLFGLLYGEIFGFFFMTILAKPE